MSAPGGSSVRWPATPPWSPATRLWALSVILLVLATVWWSVRQFTVIVILAALLAYILNPAIEWCRRRLRVRRAWATLLVYLILVITLFVLPISLAPSLLEGIGGLDLNALWSKVYADLQQILPQQMTIMHQQVALGPLYADVDASVRGAAEGMMRPSSLLSLLGLATGLVFTALGSLVTLVVSIYFAVDADRFQSWLEGKVPLPYRTAYLALMKEITAVWRSFFRGQLVLAFIIGSMTTLGVALLGLPYALPLGIVAGVLEVVPRVGPVLSVFPAIAVALVQRSSTLPDLAPSVLVVLVAGMYVLIQQIENNLLVPRILGQSVNLPPAVVLVGALAGAAIAGVPGMLLSAPIMGSARVIGSWMFHEITRVGAPEGAETNVDWPVADPGSARDPDPDEVLERSVASPLERSQKRSPTGVTPTNEASL